jgi:hypothetical protein
MTSQTRVMLIVAGAVAALLIGATGCEKPSSNPPQKPAVITQAPGDPPITIGDGSLHVHSKKNWTTNASGDMSIIPGGSSAFYANGDCGTFTEIVNNVSTQVQASVFLWTDDDTPYDISPSSPAGSGWVVTISHGMNGPVVTVSVVSNQLQISTNMGAFDPETGYDSHDRHLRPPAGVSDRVTNISVTGATQAPATPFTTWKPKSSHPHYTLGICYQ